MEEEYSIRRWKNRNTLFQGEPPKKVLVQIGKSFFTLNHSFDIKDADELKTVLDNISVCVKLLREE